MYYVAGSNLFGQWLNDNTIINNFSSIFSDKNMYKIQPDSELICVSWSYNIFKSDNTLFLLGMWNGKDKQCEEIIFPNENIRIFSEDLAIGGNDYHIIFVNKNSGNIHIFNLESSEWKNVTLNAEMPTETKSKKAKHDNIFKINVSNDTILYLNNEGNVYSGLLPSYIDTKHCEGQIIDIQCGYEHNLLLTDRGFVYSWGNGRRLQLGHEGVCDLESPTLIEALTGIKIKKIAAGGWHSLALSETGDLYAWGWNNSGQLGILEKHISKTEPLKTYAAPTLVDFFSSEGVEINIDVMDMACGSKHSVVLLKDDTVWVTGNNNYGQLGLYEEPLQYHQHDQSFENSHKIDHFKKCTTLEKGINIKELRCGQWSTILCT